MNKFENKFPEISKEPTIADIINACREFNISEELINDLEAEFDDIGELIGALCAAVIENETEINIEEFEEFLKQKGILED